MLTNTMNGKQYSASAGANDVFDANEPNSTENRRVSGGIAAIMVGALARIGLKHSQFT
jgi:hypothetical protein